jgi:two-component system response regulator NreC
MKPDVILVEHDALELVPTLLNETPGAKVVVLGTQDEPEAVQEAFAAGANGYLLSEAAESEVVAAVREVAAGGRYVNPELGARVVAAESQTRRQADTLSEREHEVLRLLALGHTNQEIAKQLVISVRTAETHRAHIMEKLEVSSRAELVRYALDRGLLDD